MLGFTFFIKNYEFQARQEFFSGTILDKRKAFNFV